MSEELAISSCSNSALVLHELVGCLIQLTVIVLWLLDNDVSPSNRTYRSNRPKPGAKTVANILLFITNERLAAITFLSHL